MIVRISTEILQGYMQGEIVVPPGRLHLVRDDSRRPDVPTKRLLGVPLESSPHHDMVGLL